MRVLTLILLFLLNIFVLNLSYAGDGVQDEQDEDVMQHENNNDNNRCKLTEGYVDDYEPKEFVKNNNLLRHTGKLVTVQAEPIVISGLLLDQRCMPISDAKIYIWHADENGEYPYEVLRKAVDTSIVNSDAFTSFTGNGIATTNNRGYFQFITIYPGKIAHKQKPYINIRAEHYRFGVVQDQLTLDKLDKVVSNDFASTKLIVSEVSGVQKSEVQSHSRSQFQSQSSQAPSPQSSAEFQTINNSNVVGGKEVSNGNSSSNHMKTYQIRLVMKR